MKTTMIVIYLMDNFPLKNYHPDIYSVHRNAAKIDCPILDNIKECDIFVIFMQDVKVEAVNLKVDNLCDILLFKMRTL